MTQPEPADQTEPITVARTALEELRRRHGRDCEKLDAGYRYHFGRRSDWCSCGADEHNAKLDRIIGGAPAPECLDTGKDLLLRTDPGR